LNFIILHFENSILHMFSFTIAQITFTSLLIYNKINDPFVIWLNKVSSSYANENRSAADPVPLTMITGTFILIRLDTCSISHGLPWINKLTSGVLVLGIMWLSSGESSSEIFFWFHIMIMCELVQLCDIPARVFYTWIFFMLRVHMGKCGQIHIFKSYWQLITERKLKCTYRSNKN
jgi:hypothetical protein